MPIRARVDDASAARDVSNGETQRTFFRTAGSGQLNAGEMPWRSRRNGLASGRVLLAGGLSPALLHEGAKTPVLLGVDLAAGESLVEDPLRVARPVGLR